MAEKKLIVILGPTGVGKTGAAARLAGSLGLPVINADSRQIFREIPIGTAAPTAEEMKRAKHYFVGVKSVTEYYSAAMYEADVTTLLEELFSKSDTAIMCGGSMMYIDAAVKGIDDIPSVDGETRRELRERLEKEGLEALLEELGRLDPEYAETVDRNNPRRVLHALEICRISGRTYTSFRRGKAKKRPFETVKIGLTLPRERLYERINARVLDMMDRGLLEEARRVYPLREANALNTVGYKELFDHFDGKTDLEEAVRRIQSDTRRYMRKQMTWFSRDNQVRWQSPEDEIIID